jgi:hypothetical protein
MLVAKPKKMELIYSYTVKLTSRAIFYEEILC